MSTTTRPTLEAHEDIRRLGNLAIEALEEAGQREEARALKRRLFREHEAQDIEAAVRIISEYVNLTTVPQREPAPEAETITSEAIEEEPDYDYLFDDFVTED